MGPEYRSTMIECSSAEQVALASLALYHQRPDLTALLESLRANLPPRRDQLVKLCISETGMSEHDAAESVDSAISLLHSFSSAPKSRRLVDCPSLGGRTLQIGDAPWGVVATIVPQSAFLFLALTCLLNAATAGNAVLLRVPGAAKGTAAILADAIPPGRRLMLVQSGGAAFVEGFCAAPVPGLIPYFGGAG